MHVLKRQSKSLDREKKTGDREHKLGFHIKDFFFVVHSFNDEHFFGILVFQRCGYLLLLTIGTTLLMVSALGEVFFMQSVDLTYD